MKLGTNVMVLEASPQK